MKIGIIGLPQTGKKSLFETITGHAISENDRASGAVIKGVAEIKDPRFDRLVAMYKPKKAVRARIDIDLLPKIEKDSIAKGDVFKDIAEVDAVCHVVRAFEDDSIYHVSGSVDPKRDIDSINAELILNDLVFIEKRLERIDKNIKRASDEASVKEKKLLLRMKAHLDKEAPLRFLKLDADEKKIIIGYPFITNKKMIIVLNVSEEKIHETTLVDKLTKDYEGLDLYIMQVSAKVESEIARLDTEKERGDFLKELRIDEPAAHLLTRLCIKALSLVSFFTVGPNEVHHWIVKAPCQAPEAAGAVHTDFQKGFIRAEVMKYDDLVSAGSEEKVKEAGRFYVKGKDYTVADGDILFIRFNV